MVKVGAATETEMKEKKARVEDALHATRAAVEEGVVAGGGVALLRGQIALEGLKVDEEQRFGVQIIRRALEEPLRMIAQNAGLEGSIVVNKVREGKDDFGYNAASDQYGNLLQMGVIDPVKVVRTALQNAASVAGLMLTTECLVAERPKEEKSGGAGSACWARSRRRFLIDVPVACSKAPKGFIPSGLFSCCAPKRLELVPAGMPYIKAEHRRIFGPRYLRACREAVRDRCSDA